MNHPNTDAIAQLLRRAGSAHGVYEETVLNGVYDQDWPGWYARWAIDNGFNDLVAHPVDAEQLGRLLADLHRQHTQAGEGRPWPSFYAERLAEQLG